VSFFYFLSLLSFYSFPFLTLFYFLSLRSRLALSP